LAIITMWAITVLAFVIIQLPPGDFVTIYINSLQASGSQVSFGQAEAMRAEYGLDQPMYIQYAKWMGKVLRGDFGMALAWNKPVIEIIGDRLSLTMIVAISAIMLTWLVALPIGIYSAVRQYSLGDYVFTFIGFIGIAVPHMVRSILNTSDHRFLMPSATLMGAILMLVCDVIAQMPGAQTTLPINAVTALVGSPVVIWVIIRQRNLKSSFA